ncbi:MAG: hypothetical protein QM688_12150 [Sphingomonas bacterium]
MRGRVASLLLALFVGALVILALIMVGAISNMPKFVEMRALSTFNVSSSRGDQQTKAKPQQRAKVTRQEKQEQHAAPPPAATAPPPPITLPGVMMLSRADYAASDIGRIKSRDQTAQSDGDQGEKSAPSGAQVAAAGGAPGGADLYYAEWYREPSRAEMVTYLPHDGRTGWGIIACRTAERYRVEDCRELGETPGSGIARALRQASWQFLVRPPRMGDKPMIGVWVRIKFDLVQGAVK